MSDTEHPAERRHPGIHRGVDLASSPDYVALRTADGRIATVPSWAAAVLREQGVAEERARVAAWLRSDDGRETNVANGCRAAKLGDAIERGEHLNTEEG